MKQPTLRLLFAGALMLLAQLAPQFAHAQYAWIDGKGTRVFSDRPPPPGTPPSRILKAPRRPMPADDLLPAAGAAVTSSPAAVASAAKPNPPTLAEREADYKKRQSQREEDAHKAQEEASRKAARQEVCKAARQEQAQLASGVRISETNANGERSYVADDERARRLARAREALADCR